MDIRDFSGESIVLHWDLASEKITLGGAITLRVECELLARELGQNAFEVFISHGDNSQEMIEKIYDAVFASSTVTFKKTAILNSLHVYPDSFFTNSEKLSSFSTERIAKLVEIFGMQPSLSWSETVLENVKKIMSTLPNGFVCLSLKNSGLGPLNSDADLKVWQVVVKEISKQFGLPIVLLGDDRVSQELMRSPNVRFLSAEGNNLSTQLAVAPVATLFLGTASGMASSVLFSDTPYFLFKHPEHHTNLMSRELKGGNHLPWANSNQFIYRMEPQIEEIMEHVHGILNK